MPLTDGRILGAPPLPTSPELLDQVSTEQHALLTRRQCLTAGMSDKAIRWRLDRGWWVAVHHGVYLTQPGRDDWHTRAVAAQLALPVPGVVSMRRTEWLSDDAGASTKPSIRCTGHGARRLRRPSSTSPARATPTSCSLSSGGHSSAASPPRTRFVQRWPFVGRIAGAICSPSCWPTSPKEPRARWRCGTSTTSRGRTGSRVASARWRHPAARASGMTSDTWTSAWWSSSTGGSAMRGGRSVCVTASATVGVRRWAG